MPSFALVHSGGLLRRGAEAASTVSCSVRTSLPTHNIWCVPAAMDNSAEARHEALQLQQRRRDQVLLAAGTSQLLVQLGGWPHGEGRPAMAVAMAVLAMAWVMPPASYARWRSGMLVALKFACSRLQVRAVRLLPCPTTLHAHRLLTPGCCPPRTHPAGIAAHRAAACCSWQHGVAPIPRRVLPHHVFSCYLLDVQAMPMPS